jgi:hypothetical protein
MILEEEIHSFVQCPYIGDDPEHFVLLHAAAMERLHRAADSPVDYRKHPGVRQHLFVDDILSGQGRAHFAGSVGAVVDDAVRCVKLLAISDRFRIAAIVIVSCFLELRNSRCSTSPGWSSNVIGELSRGLLKSATCPAVANVKASALTATAASKGTWYPRKRSGNIGLNLIDSKTIIARDQAGDESFRVIQASLGLGEFRTRRAPCPRAEHARGRRLDWPSVPYRRCRNNSSSLPVQFHPHRHCRQ